MKLDCMHLFPAYLLFGVTNRWKNDILLVMIVKFMSG